MKKRKKKIVKKNIVRGGMAIISGQIKSGIKKKK
tara:strand:+ start:136 stop:237 length:102 start_codon:yes stop_codon:yes gene_type:complete